MESEEMIKNEKVNVNEVLKIGRETLETGKVDPREARLLLAFALKVRKEEFVKIKECSWEQYKFYQTLLDRRIAGEPFAYLVGHKEFMKLDFKVNEDVLIPREDTELLVQEVLEWARGKTEKNLCYSKKEKIKILDLCTGSGCIAISLAKYLEHTLITAVDISEKALEVARENAKENQVSIQWLESNLFAKVSETYDCIVSNPPYIPNVMIEELQKEVKNEPRLALDGGKSGLDFYEIILKEAPRFLKKEGLLALEIGFDQGEVVAQMMKKQGFQEVCVKKDYGGNDRVVMGFLKQ